MDHPRNPRAHIILLFILVAVTFMVGTLRLFGPVHAAVLQNTNQNDLNQGAAIAPTFTSTVNPGTLQPTLPATTASIQPSATLISTPAPAFTQAPTPAPEQVYITDMTGIVMLAIVLVVVILVGISWGGRITQKKKGQK